MKRTFIIIAAMMLTMITASAKKVTVTIDGTVYRSCLYAMYPTQGVEEVQSEGKCRKIVENGQLVLVVGNQRYTATGQKIQ